MPYIKIGIKNSIKPNDQLYFGLSLIHLTYNYNTYYSFEVMEDRIILYDIDNLNNYISSSYHFSYKELKFNFKY